MAVASGVTMALGLLNFGLFIKPMGEELGIGRAAFGWAQSLRQLSGAATGPFFGWAVDRFGSRWLLAGAVVLSAVAVAMLSQISTEAGMLICFVVLGLSGLGTPGALLTSVPVLKWFERKRGMAVAVMSLGVPIGALIFLPFTQFLIDTYGWRDAWVILAVISVVIVVPACVIFVRRQPEDVGMLPDGGVEEIDATQPLQRQWTLTEARRTSAFWLLTIVFGLVSLSISTVGLHRMVAFMDRGLEPMMIAWAVALDAVLAGLATFLMGMASSSIASRYLGAVGFVCLGISVVMTIYSTTTLTMFASMGLFGFGIGGMMFLQNIIWAEYYGRVHLGRIRGVVMPITLILGAAGAPIAGYVHDRIGTYDPIWWAGAALMLLGAVIVVLVGPPRAPDASGTDSTDTSSSVHRQTNPG
jgi:MFS family permease